MIKVYGSPRSTCTRKVLTVLHEKVAQFDFELVDLAKREHKSDAHVARHPFGVIPVLEDDGFAMYESRAIIRYLDRKLAGASLTPTEPHAYARMEQFISIEASYFSGPALDLLKVTWKREGYGPEQVANARPLIERAVAVASHHLASNDYFAGGQFSLADVTWMPYVEGLANTEFKDLVLSSAPFAAWWARVSERPSWRKVSGRAA
jgi:glutathione S-transferase